LPHCTFPKPLTPVCEKPETTGNNIINNINIFFIYGLPAGKIIVTNKKNRIRMTCYIISAFKI
jgi:hypothetical protein